jgi:hypothetical protein
MEPTERTETEATEATGYLTKRNGGTEKKYIVNSVSPLLFVKFPVPSVPSAPVPSVPSAPVPSVPSAPVPP